MLLSPGTQVKMNGVKDAVIIRFLKKATKTRKALYQIEYTVDDELERQSPSGRRNQQPRFENEFTVL